MHPINPTVAWLTVTRRCNFRCRWCYAEGTEYKIEEDMSLEFATTLARVAKEAGVKKFLLIGGEPTLWPPLTEFNEWCAREGLRTILVTNGAQFGSDAFWTRYQRRPNDTIGLSLKAVTPERLEAVAGVENFKLVKRGIVRAIEAGGAHVNITYNHFCADYLVEMVRFVTDCGVRSVKIEFCSTTFVKGHPSSKFMLDPKVLADNIVRVYPELERLTGGSISLDMMTPLCIWPEEFIRTLYVQGRLLSVCHVHKRRGLIFDGEGNILMCNALFDYPIGRYGREFADGASLLAWLNTPKVLCYYDRIGCYPSAACKECAWYSECGGGCPLRWATYRPDDIVRSRKAPLGG